jgi:hypothetical protein
LFTVKKDSKSTGGVCEHCHRKVWTRYWRLDRNGDMICDDCWGVDPSTNAKLDAKSSTAKRPG